MSRLDDITVSRKDWSARPPKHRDTTFTKDEGLVVHYSARDAATLEAHWPDCYNSWRAHQTYHMDTRGWSDLAYNFAVCPHGFVFEGRGWDAQNAANRPLNSKTLSICYDGDGNDVPGPAATDAFKLLIERAVLEQGWDAQVRGHSEISDTGTQCPGSAIRAGLLPVLKSYVNGLDHQPADPVMPFNSVIDLAISKLRELKR